jgi:hypothetical protein
MPRGIATGGIQSSVAHNHLPNQKSLSVRWHTQPRIGRCAAPIMLRRRMLLTALHAASTPCVNFLYRDFFQGLASLSPGAESVDVEGAP